MKSRRRERVWGPFGAQLQVVPMQGGSSGQPAALNGRRPLPDTSECLRQAASLVQVESEVQRSSSLPWYPTRER